MLFYPKTFQPIRGAGGQGLKTRDVREIEEVDILPIENLNAIASKPPAKNH